MKVAPSVKKIPTSNNESIRAEETSETHGLVNKLHVILIEFPMFTYFPKN
jgi:hypothetical protein